MYQHIARLALALTALFFALPLGAALAQQDAQFTNCFNWCGGTSECVACSSYSDCGTYYADINDFSNGKRWYACRARASSGGRNSERNRRACLDYCAEHSDRCDMCSTVYGCGPNYRRMRSFTGRGNNWYACEDSVRNNPGYIRQEKIETGTISIPEWRR